MVNQPKQQLRQPGRLGCRAGNVADAPLPAGSRVRTGAKVADLQHLGAAQKLLAALLYETSPTDPLIFVAVPLIVIATALSASLIPAARAAWLDPSVALRTD